MDKLEFLQSVLGDEGYYCIVGLKPNEKPIQKLYTRLEDAVVTADNLKDVGRDVFYAMATFEDGSSRKTSNVKQVRSLFVDLDCGPFKPYENQTSAIVALKEFCKSSGMPRPFTVNSGGGVHAYWPFGTPVSREEWIPVATALKQLCETHDLHADPAVTADAARILRIPGTSNFKEEEPRSVKILGTGVISTFTDLKALIGEPVKLTASYIPRGEMDEVTKILVGNYQYRFEDILIKCDKNEGCPQIAYMVQEKATGNVPYNLWRAGLSIARYCEDAPTAFLKVSEGDPRFSLETMESTIRGLKGGPYKCETIEGFNPKGCEGCIHKGTIKTPIVIGRVSHEATEEEHIVEDTPENVAQGHTQTYVIPKFPPPYFRGKNGGVYKRIIKEDDEIEVMVYHHDIYVTRRLDDADIGEALVIRLHLPKDGVREFTVPLSVATSKDELRKHLTTRGVTLIKTDEMMYYLKAWTDQMQATGKADKARRQFGWTSESHESFVVGDKEITADGVEYNPPSAATAQYYPIFQPKGTLEEWKNAVDFYNSPGMEMHQFTIGLAFGTVFTAFTPVNAALFHMFSQESGIGKTTTMYAGASIWGDPVRMSLKETDTHNSKMLRAEVYKDIFFPMDEMTNVGPKEASDLIYQMTSGTQKNRMSASVNQERLRGEPWHLTGASTANASMMEKISVYKTLPAGEGMRLLEVCVKPVPGLLKVDTDKLSMQILNNYGHACVPFLQYILSDIDSIKALYRQVQEKLDKRYKFKHQDRFHSVTAANGIMGLMIAKKVGLINFNISNVVDWLGTVVTSMQDRVASLDIGAEALISQYAAEKWGSMLRITSAADNRTSKNSGMEHLTIAEATPKGELMGRLEYDIDMLYLMIPPLKKWCSDRQINYSGLIDSLRRGRTKAKVAKKRMAKGTRGDTGSVYVLWIYFKDILDEDRQAELNAEAEAEDLRDAD